MRAIAILLGGVMVCGTAIAADNATTTTKERTTVQKEPGQTTVQRSTKRSTQGEVNANDPSSPNRATGTERAEERHEMQKERKTSKSGSTKDKTTQSSTTERSTTSSGGTSGMGPGGASGMSGSGMNGSSTTTRSTEKSTTTTK